MKTFFAGLFLLLAIFFVPRIPGAKFLRSVQSGWNKAIRLSKIRN